VTRAALILTLGVSLLVAGVGGFAPSARAQVPPVEVRTYVVQPGDSAWSIAAEFYGSGEQYPIIYRYNAFAAKPPFLLKPGQVLRLPILGTGPEAQLDWLRRDVKAKPPRALDWLEAHEQMNLWRLYRVATGDESAARIVFEDLSDLKLRENSLLVIYGAAASAARTARSDKREVRLEEGTIQGGLASLDEAVNPRPLVVKTPSGQVDLLGKLAQVQAELTASIVSVFDGKAVVRAQGASVDVPGGQGTVVKKGKPPEPARPLPAAPAWREPGPALVAVLAGQKGTWEAAWQPIERAATYRVELASDDTFAHLLFDVEIGAGVTRLRLADLAPGRYAVRISTRDQDKLESQPGASRRVEVVQMQPLRAMKAGPDGVFQAVGFVQIELDKEIGASTFHATDQGPELPGSEPIRLTTPGRHSIALRVGIATTTMLVDILSVSAAIEVVGEPLAGDGASAIGLRVRDELGHEALLPGLALETSRGVSLPLTVVPGGYRAELPPPADGERVALRARWLGGELGTREVHYRAPTVAPPAQRERLALTPHRVSRLVPGPLGSPRPETRIAIDTTFAHVEKGPGALALSLDGELAMGALGLTAGLVAEDVRLSESNNRQAVLQDLSLGLRYSFGAAGAAVVTPYLRAAIPLGPGHEARVFGLEPGVQLRLEFGALFFDARLAFLVLPDLASGSLLRPGALVALGWRSSPLVSVSVSGESLANLDGDPWRHLVGFGFNLHLGQDVRLGFALGIGVGAATRDELGAVTGRVVVDIGILD